MSTEFHKTSEVDTLAESFQYGTSMFESPQDRQVPHHTYLFGFPIAHSLAPYLHSSLFSNFNVPWTYTLVESKDKDDFVPKLRDPSCIGCAVTMPHKVTFMNEVDTVTEEGRVIGALNTVFKRKGNDGKIKYIGTNTDCIGIREAFIQNFPEVVSYSTGRPALVIGGGGTCRSSIYTLWKWMGASTIYVVNRIPEEVTEIIASFEAHPEFSSKLIHVETVEQAEASESPALIVNAVPDIAPKTSQEIQAKEVVATFLNKDRKGFVLEMCYHPQPRTTFYSQAEGTGWKVIPGTEAMIHQGVAQQVLWLEVPSRDFNVKEAEPMIRKAMKLPTKI